MKLRMICRLLMFIIPIIITIRYPFIQNMEITSCRFRGKYLTVTGTMEVLLNDQAWTEFGYKEDNFYWFNEWWQDQVGHRFGPFRLVSVNWTLIEHTEARDTLAFEIVLAFRRHR